MTVTGKPPADPDDVELDSTYFPVSAIEGIAKEVIRAALPVDRFAMWQAYTETVRDAAEHSADRMPWDDSAVAVTSITARAARDALTGMLKAVPVPVEQSRLAKIAARECERVEAAMEAGASGSGVPVSALRCQVCSKPLPAGSKASRRTCSDACRQRAYQARKARSRQGPAAVRA